MGRARTRTAAGIVLDTGALIALERGDKRMIALVRRVLAQGRAFRVPAGVVGQAWRNGRVQGFGVTRVLCFAADMQSISTETNQLIALSRSLIDRTDGLREIEPECLEECRSPAWWNEH